MLSCLQSCAAVTVSGFIYFFTVSPLPLLLLLADMLLIPPPPALIWVVAFDYGKRRGRTGGEFLFLSATTTAVWDAHMPICSANVPNTSSFAAKQEKAKAHSPWNSNCENRRSFGLWKLQSSPLKSYQQGRLLPKREHKPTGDLNASVTSEGTQHNKFQQTATEKSPHNRHQVTNKQTNPADSSLLLWLQPLWDAL